MKRFVSLMLVAMLLVLTGEALAASGYVYGSSGDSYVRTGPGLGYASIGVLYRGSSAPYTGQTSVDYRGVPWYSISFNGRSGWVSSRYTTLSGGGYYPAPNPYPYPNPQPNPQPSVDSKYDLSNFGYRTVVTKGRGRLVFQTKPRGSFMAQYKYFDGDQIYVNLYWREDGYAIAYQNGTYGYVDASYISW